MAKPFILDDPAAQECIFAFCRSCGHEMYKGQNCWDGVISKARYFDYKNTHPSFAEKVQEARRWFFLSSPKEKANFDRYEQALKIIDDKLKHGETETKIDAKFTYKTDEKGSVILDSNNQPIIDKLVGEAAHHVTRKPCSDKLAQWIVDRTDDSLREP
jgi:hypothetical protein